MALSLSNRARPDWGSRHAIRRVAGGGSVLDPEVVRWMLGQRRDASALSELTPREHEVLGLLAERCSNAGVASRIFNRRVLAVLAHLEDGSAVRAGA